MIRVKATGISQFSYEVLVKGYVDYSEYKQILDNLEETKRQIKALGKEYGYEKEQTANESTSRQAMEISHWRLSISARSSPEASTY